MQTIELKGQPQNSFIGCLLLVPCATPSRFIQSSNVIAGVFDTNGILQVTTQDLPNPPYILLLTNGDDQMQNSCPQINELDSTNVIDAIGIPNSRGMNCGPDSVDVDLSVYPKFDYNGPESPERVFRDSKTNEWYAVIAIGGNPNNRYIIDIGGNNVAPTQFIESNPFISTFGSINPSISALSFTAIINEFQPSPLTQQIELLGYPFAEFSGCIISIDCDASVLMIDRAITVDDVSFDENGLLVVQTQDLEDPSYILVLLDSACPPTGIDPTTSISPNNVLDAVGIPDTSLDVNRCMPSNINGDLSIYPGFQDTGSEPQLVFRDGVTRAWYAINDPTGNVVNKLDATDLDASEFVFGDPLMTSYSQINPSIETPPPSQCYLCEGSTLPPPQRQSVTPPGSDMMCLDIYTNSLSLGPSLCATEKSSFQDYCCGIATNGGGGEDDGPSCYSGISGIGIGNEPVCLLCGTYEPPGIPLSSIQMRYIGDFTCGQLYDRGLNGFILASMCGPLQDFA